MPKIAIVSGGDANYFDLLIEQAASIRSLDPKNNLDITYLDGGGFTEDHIKQLNKYGVKLLDPGWPNEAVKRKAGSKDFLKINLAKPCLNKYFPDHDIIIWIDGDAWLQTLEAIELATLVARKGKLAVVSQNTRFREQRFHFRKKLFGWVELRTIFHKNAKRARLESKHIWNLANMAVLNAGFYALRQDAPHWDVWTKWRDKAIKHGRSFTSDQLSLALTVYEDNLPFETLPEYCNYMGPWRMDEQKNYVEIHAPYRKVSVVHMAGLEEERKDPNHFIDMVMPDDSISKQPIRFSSWKKKF